MATYDEALVLDKDGSTIVFGCRAKRDPGFLASLHSQHSINAQSQEDIEIVLPENKIRFN